VVEEADETIFWPECLVESGMCQWIVYETLAEAHELLAIFAVGVVASASAADGADQMAGRHVAEGRLSRRHFAAHKPGGIDVGAGIDGFAECFSPSICDVRWSVMRGTGRASARRTRVHPSEHRRSVISEAYWRIGEQHGVCTGFGSMSSTRV
jgi:hypothetical protein